MGRQSTEWEVIVLVVQIVVMNETVLGMRSLLSAEALAGRVRMMVGLGEGVFLGMLAAIRPSA